MDFVMRDSRSSTGRTGKKCSCAGDSSQKDRGAPKWARPLTAASSHLATTTAHSSRWNTHEFNIENFSRAPSASDGDTRISGAPPSTRRKQLAANGDEQASDDDNNLSLAICYLPSAPGALT
ncbi:hypothetical protein FRC08_016107 [Ceratobasidium sp. 394]|nr:hypothetical protein FRC08_016107 [Ceratobasidium sp. 394]